MRPRQRQHLDSLDSVDHFSSSQASPPSYLLVSGADQCRSLFVLEVRVGQWWADLCIFTPSARTE